MKVVSRAKDDQHRSFMDKLKNPKLLHEAMLSSDDEETPGACVLC